MVKDLFERIQNNKGPLGKWAHRLRAIFTFPN
jgi:glycine C-acetyltransferase